MERSSSQHIIHCLKWRALFCPRTNPTFHTLFFIYMGSKCGSQIEHKIIDVFGLYIIYSVTTLFFLPAPFDQYRRSRNDLAISLCRQEIIRGVPVCQTLSCTTSSIGFIPNIIIATWKIFSNNPVVDCRHCYNSTWYSFVNTIFTKQCCGEFHILVNIPVPRSKSRRSEIIDDARIALMTILITQYGL